MKETQKHKILKVLWDGMPHTAVELNNNGYISQHGARIKELRDEHSIDIQNVRYGSLSSSERQFVAERYYDYRRLSFYKLITPTNLIDFKSLTVKQGQGVLNV